MGILNLGRLAATPNRKTKPKHGFLRSRRENNRYPHYIHNRDNLIRFGDLSRTFMCTRTSARPGS
jgi:hypothetical protein